MSCAAESWWRSNKPVQEELHLVHITRISLSLLLFWSGSFSLDATVLLHPLNPWEWGSVVKDCSIDLFVIRFPSFTEKTNYYDCIYSFSLSVSANTTTLHVSRHTISGQNRSETSFAMNSESRGTCKQHVSSEHFSQNAASSPHVYGLGVVVGGQEQTGGTVPLSYQSLRQIALKRKVRGEWKTESAMLKRDNSNRFVAIRVDACEKRGWILWQCSSTCVGQCAWAAHVALICYNQASYFCQSRNTAKSFNKGKWFSRWIFWFTPTEPSSFSSPRLNIYSCSVSLSLWCSAGWQQHILSLGLLPPPLFGNMTNHDKRETQKTEKKRVHNVQTSNTMGDGCYFDTMVEWCFQSPGLWLHLELPVTWWSQLESCPNPNPKNAVSCVPLHLSFTCLERPLSPCALSCSHIAIYPL